MYQQVNEKKKSDVWTSRVSWRLHGIVSCLIKQLNSSGSGLEKWWDINETNINKNNVHVHDTITERMKKYGHLISIKYTGRRK